MTALSFVVCCSFVSHVPIQVICKQGNSFTSNTTLPTTQWYTRCKPLCLHERFARTTKWEPNRRPYTTERPLSLKTRGAEPPSLYDGTSTFTQIAQHNTSQLFQHLFLVREHRPPRSHAQSRTFQTGYNVHCAHTAHSTGRVRRKQRNTAEQHAANQDALHTSLRNWCTRHNMSHSTPHSFSTVPTPFTQTIANEQ